MKDCLVKLAEQVATEAHSGQFRRGGVIPYIVHPKAVASRVGEDIDARVVAWLHDVLEDCDVTEDQLRQKGFTEKQINAIKVMTKKKGQSYDEYLENIASCPIATKVKIADMISNLADNPTKRQIEKYAKGLLRLSKEL